MAQKKPARNIAPVLGHGDSDRSGGGEDADAILDTGLGIMRRDLERIAERSNDNAAQLGINDAQTVAGYVRALGGIARARHGRHLGGLGKMSMEELLAEVAKIPEVRAALGGGR